MGYKHNTMCKPTGRGPQWTYGELAAHWGMTTQFLTQVRAKFPGFPDPSGRHTANACAGARTYYDLHAAVKWYRAVSAQLRAEIDALKKDVTMVDAGTDLR